MQAGKDKCHRRTLSAELTGGKPIAYPSVAFCHFCVPNALSHLYASISRELHPGLPFKGEGKEVDESSDREIEQRGREARVLPPENPGSATVHSYYIRPRPSKYFREI